MLDHDNFVELQWNDEIVITMYLEEFQRRERILFKSGEYDSFYVIISMARRVKTRSRAVRRVLIDLINVCYDAMEILFVIRVISLDLSVNIINACLSLAF